MATKKKSSAKKNSVSFSEELFACSSYEENYAAEMEREKQRLEEIRKEQQRRFGEFEQQYNLLVEKSYIGIAKKFLVACGLKEYPQLKDALALNNAKEKLENTKGFGVLIEADEKRVLDLIDFLAADEIAVACISEYLKGSKPEPESVEKQTDLFENSLAETENETVSETESETEKVLEDTPVSNLAGEPDRKTGSKSVSESVSELVSDGQFLPGGLDSVF